MERINRIAEHVLVGALRPNTTAAAAPSSPIITKLKSKIAALAKEVTVEMAINGARSMKALLTETSDLDAAKGIAYRGKSLFDCNKELPKAPGGEAGLPEGAFWLLLTGEVPSPEDVKAMTEEFHARSSVPAEVYKTLDALPKTMHPMTQLASAMLSLQQFSKFQKKYDEGMKKGEYWEVALEDCLDLVARMPVVAAYIYHRTFKNGGMPKYDSKLDWAGNYAAMLDVNDSEGFKEATRLYLMLHADHEGGNVSAHTTQLVGSALSDPYYSWAAGLCGLAGPLHGLANQECLAWLKEVMVALNGKEPTKGFIVDYVQKTLKSGKVVPGFGHAVLRQPDPRYMLEREFALKHCKDDPLFKLVDCVFQAVPPTLEKTGKVKNPYPNVDAHSGQLMYFYNLKQDLESCHIR